MRRTTSDTRRPGACTGLLVALVAACGCDVRDEAVHTMGANVVWPSSTDQSAPAGSAAAAWHPAVVGYAADAPAAIRRSAAEGRPLLLVFGASWCRWSGELARGPLADPEVIARTRPFVCAFVDADHDAATCRAFGVAAFPTVIVIDAAGQERFRAAGSSAAGGLAAALDDVAPPGDAPRRLADEARGITR